MTTFFAAATGIFSFITADIFQPLIDGLKELFPVILVAMVPVWLLRKGYAMVKGAIKGA